MMGEVLRGASDRDNGQMSSPAAQLGNDTEEGISWVCYYGLLLVDS